VRQLIAAVFWLLLLASGLAQAKPIEETTKVAVQVANLYGKEVAQEIVVTLLYDDATRGPRPLLVVQHGRATDAQGRAALGRARYASNANWFAQLGFLVAVPTRVGYGASAGEDVEDTGPCTRKSYAAAFAAVANQTTAVINELRKRADVDPGRAIVLGQSFGGAGAIALAATAPDGLQAAINFAGGGGGNPVTNPGQPCDATQLRRLFGQYGEAARVPTLWLYAENDRFFGAKLPQEWFDAFKAGGGIGEFVQYPPNGDDGHLLFTRAPEVWRSKVLEFLRATGYSKLP
jgi:dienelactone hydrolase